MATNQYERIQQKLVTTAQTGIFYTVQYDSSTKLVKVLNTQIIPASVIAQEINAEFSIPIRNRQTFRYSKTEWSWELTIVFNQAVSLETFEDTITATPIRINATSTSSQILLELTSSRYDHPPQQEPQRGTRAVLSFKARMSPV